MGKRQNDWKEDQLPPEVMESAGTVVSDLQRAKKLGRNLLRHDAAEMVKVAKRVKMSYSGVSSDADLFLSALIAKPPVVASCRCVTLQLSSGEHRLFPPRSLSPGHRRALRGYCGFL